MENQSSELFFMQHLASISHQKIYPSIQTKIEMPLWKTLHITRLWNRAREKEIYLTQQQQKNDWWFHQMITSTPVTTTSPYHRLLDTNDDDDNLTQNWFGNDDTITKANNNDHINEQDNDNDDNPIETNTNNTTHPTEEQQQDPDTTTLTKDHSSLLSHTPIEALWTEDELVSLLAVTQDRKRKYEEDPDICQKGGPTSPPANRPTTSPPMVKV
ncbi:hypothetical protein BC941DRAFT_499896 [Chlamydoabsidia padenii]|nr:hypothetical protein BC941DRAFT_499896 [Chlamydoabsidia padenii]